MSVVKIKDLPSGDATFTNRDKVVVMDHEDQVTKTVDASTIRSYALDEALINEMIDQRLQHHGLIPS